MAAHKVVLHFPAVQVDQPVMNQLVRTYDLDFNILRAHVTPQEEGLLVIELSGDEERFEQALEWVRSLGVRTQPLEEDVVRLADRCTDCGACVTHCPTEALHADPDTREVAFDKELCIACGLCVPACPPRAMVLQF